MFFKKNFVVFSFLAICGFSINIRAGEFLSELAIKELGEDLSHVKAGKGFLTELFGKTELTKTEFESLKKLVNDAPENFTKLGKDLEPIFKKFSEGTIKIEDHVAIRDAMQKLQESLSKTIEELPEEGDLSKMLEVTDKKLLTKFNNALGTATERFENQELDGLLANNFEKIKGKIPKMRNRYRVLNQIKAGGLDETFSDWWFRKKLMWSERGGWGKFLTLTSPLYKVIALSIVGFAFGLSHFITSAMQDKGIAEAAYNNIRSIQPFGLLQLKIPDKLFYESKYKAGQARSIRRHSGFFVYESMIFDKNGNNWKGTGNYFVTAARSNYTNCSNDWQSEDITSRYFSGKLIHLGSGLEFSASGQATSNSLPMHKFLSTKETDEDPDKGCLNTTGTIERFMEDLSVSMKSGTPTIRTYHQGVYASRETGGVPIDESWIKKFLKANMNPKSKTWRKLLFKNPDSKEKNPERRKFNIGLYSLEAATVDKQERKNKFNFKTRFPGEYPTTAVGVHLYRTKATKLAKQIGDYDYVLAFKMPALKNDPYFVPAIVPNLQPDGNIEWIATSAPIEFICSVFPQEETDTDSISSPLEFSTRSFGPKKGVFCYKPDSAPGSDGTFRSGIPYGSGEIAILPLIDEYLKRSPELYNKIVNLREKYDKKLTTAPKSFGGLTIESAFEGEFNKNKFYIYKIDPENTENKKNNSRILSNSGATDYVVLINSDIGITSRSDKNVSDIVSLVSSTFYDGNFAIGTIPSEDGEDLPGTDFRDTKAPLYFYEKMAIVEEDSLSTILGKIATKAAKKIDREIRISSKRFQEKINKVTEGIKAKERSLGNEPISFFDKIILDPASTTDSVYTTNAYPGEYFVFSDAFATDKIENFGTQKYLISLVSGQVKEFDKDQEKLKTTMDGDKPKVVNKNNFINLLKDKNLKQKISEISNLQIIFGSNILALDVKNKSKNYLYQKIDNIDFQAWQSKSLTERLKEIKDFFVAIKFGEAKDPESKLCSKLRNLTESSLNNYKSGVFLQDSRTGSNKHYILVSLVTGEIVTQLNCKIMLEISNVENFLNKLAIPSGAKNQIIKLIRSREPKKLPEEPVEPEITFDKSLASRILSGSVEFLKKPFEFVKAYNNKYYVISERDLGMDLNFKKDLGVSFDNKAEFVAKIEEEALDGLRKRFGIIIEDGRERLKVPNTAPNIFEDFVKKEGDVIETKMVGNLNCIFERFPHVDIGNSILIKVDPSGTGGGGYYFDPIELGVFNLDLTPRVAKYPVFTEKSGDLLVVSGSKGYKERIFENTNETNIFFSLKNDKRNINAACRYAGVFDKKIIFECNNTGYYLGTKPALADLPSIETSVDLSFNFSENLEEAGKTEPGNKNGTIRSMNLEKNLIAKIYRYIGTQDAENSKFDGKKRKLDPKFDSDLVVIENKDGRKIRIFAFSNSTYNEFKEISENKIKPVLKDSENIENKNLGNLDASWNNQDKDTQASYATLKFGSKAGQKEAVINFYVPRYEKVAPQMLSKILGGEIWIVKNSLGGYGLFKNLNLTRDFKTVSSEIGPANLYFNKNLHIEKKSAEDYASAALVGPNARYLYKYNEGDRDTVFYPGDPAAYVNPENGILYTSDGVPIGINLEDALVKELIKARNIKLTSIYEEFDTLNM